MDLQCITALQCFSRVDNMVDAKLAQILHGGGWEQQQRPHSAYTTVAMLGGAMNMSVMMFVLHKS